MIRRAIQSDFPDRADEECLIRIQALVKAYGCDVPFIQYFTDEQGGFLSIMDGTAVLSASNNAEEWVIFIQMHPDICALHCSSVVAPTLMSGGWQGREGVVMRYEGATPEADASVCVSPSLPKVYHLLEQHFPGISPFNYWYPDVSHRLRHQCSHISCVIRDGEVVSTAMTVAETNCEAIIGQVATDSRYRRQGMAATCVKSTIFQCKDKTLYILPINENAERLYGKLGFSPCGVWYELQRI